MPKLGLSPGTIPFFLCGFLEYINKLPQIKVEITDYKISRYPEDSGSHKMANDGCHFDRIPGIRDEGEIFEHIFNLQRPSLMYS